MNEKSSEKVVIVKNNSQQIIYTGSVERGFAHQYGVCHLTVIVVPFITDGVDKGKWIVHNRRDKQLAKGLNCPQYSFNLFGGHCNPPLNESEIIGKEISQKFLLESALREISEELYLLADKDSFLKCWGNNRTISAVRYPVSIDKMIRIGYVFCNEGNDKEISYLYALPIPSADTAKLIAADDYHKTDGTKENIALPIFVKAEKALYELYQDTNPDIEICNAITRLWKDQNKVVYHKLIKMIQNY